MVEQFSSSQRGFTLVELMIVVAIIGVLAAIAYPNYKNSTIKAKRGDMMAEMQNIASRIQSQKLAMGNYNNVQLTQVYAEGTSSNSTTFTPPAGGTLYPHSGSPLYEVTVWNTSAVPASQITGTTLGTSTWEIRAVPKNTELMANDGTLTLNDRGIKCRNTTPTKCGSGDEWNK